jgi:predicted PurR-regulated permease PerM
MTATAPPDVERRERLMAAAARGDAAWRRLGWRLRAVTPARLVRFLLVVVALAAIARLIIAAWATLLPFLVGALLAYVLLPLMTLLDRWLPRWLAIVLVFAVFVVVLALALAFLIPPLIHQFTALVQSLPNATAMSRLLQRFDTWLKALPPQAQQAVNNALQQGETALKSNLDDLIKGTVRVVFGLVTSVLNTVLFLAGFIIVPFWLFYVLKDEQRGRRAFVRWLPPWLRPDVVGVLRTIDHVLSGWLRGQIVLSAFLGAAVFVGLRALTLLGVQGLNYILLISVFVALTSPIPFVGSYLSAVPPVLMALLGGGVRDAVLVVALFVVVQNIQDNVLSPRIMGQSLNIHPAIVMPLVLIMGRYGILWIILAGPVAALARDLFLYVYRRFGDPPRPAGVLPGEPVPASAPADAGSSATTAEPSRGGRG